MGVVRSVHLGSRCRASGPSQAGDLPGRRTGGRLLSGQAGVRRPNRWCSRSRSPEVRPSRRPSAGCYSCGDESAPSLKIDPGDAERQGNESVVPWPRLGALCRAAAFISVFDRHGARSDGNARRARCSPHRTSPFNGAQLPEDLRRILV